LGQDFWASTFHLEMIAAGLRAAAHLSALVILAVSGAELVDGDGEGQVKYRAQTDDRFMDRGEASSSARTSGGNFLSS
jgi:hypothetical protein